MTPAEMLSSFLALTIGQVATVLNQYRGNGEPDREFVRKLIRDGKLKLVDDSQPVTRWTVSAAELRRYLGGAA